MPISYSDIFNQNTDFQRAVNLTLDQGCISLVEKYIPTTASATVMARYLRAVVKPGNDRASILIGPYGKGKSHTLFVVLAAISETGEQADTAFALLANRLDNVNREAADLIRKIRNEKIRLLPIVVNDRYLDVRQAFLASLKSALVAADLMKVMPDNYYAHSLETIDRWRKEFPSTYEAYLEYLKNNGHNAIDFETRLKQFDAETLTLFKDCHKSILSGTEYDPLIESDVPTMYRSISEALSTQTEYKGIFVVFDEFGKYLESAISNGDRFKALQDLAEMCSRSNNSVRMLLTCVSHKAISEYASNLNHVQRNTFRTVEGRFESVYFTSTFEGSFSLISGALGRNREIFTRYIDEHADEYADTIQECNQLGCFAGYESSVESIVNQCFPMHPLTTLSLMKLSEQAAQNERTLFTFLADPSSQLSSFIRDNKGEYVLAPVNIVYDYFHETIRENSYDTDLRRTIIHADSLIPTLSVKEQELIKAIVLFSMVADNCLHATKKTLKAALQWSEENFEQVLQKLEQGHHIYTRRSDGIICLMRSTTENVRRDIEHEVMRRAHIDIAVQFSELHDPGYTIPRRYNDKYEMVRFFQNVFVSSKTFSSQPNSSFLYEYGFADGYVIYLLGNMDKDEVQATLKRWNDPCVVVLLPTSEFTSRTSIEECAAIKHLMEHPVDEVAAEELTYYFEDLMQMVNQAYATLFQKNALLVSQDGLLISNNLSSEISTLCEMKLYPDCPIICHEMINRSSISGQMKQSRAKVIDAILHNNDFMEAFSIKTAEGPIIKAISGSLKSENMRKVVSEITEYIGRCENGKKPIKSLYDKLTCSPFGIRKGILPILLAYCLRNQHQNAVLYNHGQEIALTGDTMNVLDEHYSDYELLVDKGSADQSAYIQLLHDKYTPMDTVPDIRAIYDAMRKIVRSLPRSARANQKIISNGQIESVSPLTINIRSALIRFDVNAREVLINQLPKHCGMLAANENCAQSIVNVLQDLCDYTKRLTNGMRQSIRTRMDAQQAQSIRGTMTIWQQRQSASQLNHSFSGSTAALLSVIRSTENHTDAEWINMIAVALTGLPIEDWSDKQVEEFNNLLDNALTEMETVQDQVMTGELISGIHLSLGGVTLEQPLPTQEIEGLVGVAYNSVHSALSEFGDSLSTEEKLLILANLMLHINE